MKRNLTRKIPVLIVLLALLAVVLLCTACGERSLTVSFESNGGAEVAAVTVKSGKLSQIPTAPTRDDYEFDGWYWDDGVWSEPLSTDGVVSASRIVSGNLTLYAKWREGAEASGTGVSLKGFEKRGDAYACKVAHSVSRINLYASVGDEQIVFVSAAATWTLSMDASGAPVKADKVWVLSEGANAAYITVQCGGAVKTHKLEAYRNHIYNLTFDTAGGDAITPAIAEEGTIYTPTAPTREGYVFNGWNVNFTQPIEADIAATAQWIANSYTISTTLGGGESTPSNPNSYTVESAAITLNNPTRRGYEFIGWSGTDVGETPQKSVTIAHGSMGDREYTAHWKRTTYSISYVLDGGYTIGATNPTTYTVESAAITLNNPTRRGYDFIGWSGTDIGETPQKSVTIAANSVGDRSYSAHWEIIVYAIAYDLAGGENAAANPTEYTVESAAITLAAPTLTGCTFAGWTGTDLGISPQKTVTIARGSIGDRSYCANWDGAVYAIAYDLGGGVNAPTNPTTYKNGDVAVSISAPTRDGYEFLGWTYEGVTEPQQSVTIPSGSYGKKSFTAHWSIIDYSVTYNLGGGTNAVANPSVFNVESGRITLAAPTRVGYRFDGWTGTGVTTPILAPGFDAVYEQGDREYTAHWSAVEYALNYETSGGINAAANPTSYTIESAAITLAAPTRRGYEFSGWSGSDITGAPQKTVTIASGSIGVRAYTAHWSRITYAITYNASGGTNSALNPTEYTVESAAITLAAPTRDGYTFIGWGGTGLGGAPSDSVTIASGSIGDREYTAHWSGETYSVSIDLAGGEVDCTLPTAYTYESANVTLPTPTRRGYDFIGWSGSGIGETPSLSVTIASHSVGDRSYTASWSAVIYTVSYVLAGGANAATNPTEYTIESEAITLAAPTRDGYAFSGWTGGGITEAQTSVTIAAGSIGDLTFTAHWSLSAFVLTYAAEDGGSVSCSVSSGTSVPYGQSVTLNAAANLGYLFDGWYSGGELLSTQIAYTFTMPGGDYHVTARFVSDGYTYYDKYTYKALTYTLASPTAAPNMVAGGGITASDYTCSGNTVTLNQSYLSSLKGGRYNLLLRCSNSADNEIVKLVVYSSHPYPYNLKIDYDVDYPNAVITFDCAAMNGTYTYQLDSGVAVACKSGDVIPGYTKDARHTVKVTVSGEGITSRDATVMKEAYLSGGVNYINKSYSYQGRTGDYYIETREEMYRIVEYIVQSEGVVNRTATAEYPYGTYSVDIFLVGAVKDALYSDASELLNSSAHSFRSNKSYSFGGSYVGNVMTLKIYYLSALHDEQYESGFRASPYRDNRQLLTVSERGDSYENFKINDWTKTQTVATPSDLESLPFGYKPIIAATGVTREIYDEAKSILRRYVSDSMNDFQKVTAIYDWLCLNVVYDYSVYDMLTLRNNLASSADVSQSDSYINGFCEKYPCWTARLQPIIGSAPSVAENKVHIALLSTTAFVTQGALLNKLAVCDGIASAFRLLCLIEGIEAIEVVGNVNNDGHAWNKVKIDGEWYGVDATWGRGSSYVTHKYLLVDEAYFIKNKHQETDNRHTIARVENLATGTYDWALHYTYQGLSHVVTTQQEMNALVGAYMAAGITTIEFIDNCPEDLAMLFYNARVANGETDAPLVYYIDNACGYTVVVRF